MIEPMTFLFKAILAVACPIQLLSLFLLLLCLCSACTSSQHTWLLGSPKGSSCIHTTGFFLIKNDASLTLAYPQAWVEQKGV